MSRNTNETIRAMFARREDSSAVESGWRRYAAPIRKGRRCSPPDRARDYLVRSLPDRRSAERLKFEEKKGPSEAFGEIRRGRSFSWKFSNKFHLFHRFINPRIFCNFFYLLRDVSPRFNDLENLPYTNFLISGSFAIKTKSSRTMLWNN